MSAIIDIARGDQQLAYQQHAAFFREAIKPIFNTHYPEHCKELHDTHTQIRLFVKSGQLTYRLSTLWCFQMDQNCLSLKINFYNKPQNCFLMAESDRIRFETYLLMRLINGTILGYQFKIDGESGILSLHYTVQWDNFEKVFSKHDNIKNFVKSVFSIIRKYDELFVFVEPSMLRTNKPQENINNPKTLQFAQKKAHKFRYIIKSRKNMRSNLHSSIGDLFRIKQMKQKISAENVNKIKSVFMQSLSIYHQSNLSEQENEIDQENIEKELSSIQKNSAGAQSSKSKSKIVMGLLKIKEESQTAKKVLSDDGAHSKIYHNKFRYAVVDTLYKGTVMFETQIWKNKSKEAKGQLAYKVCNPSSQTSVNSFKNQLSVLKHLKQESSSYIGRYYLMIKEQWDQKDILYMQKYKHNLYDFMNNYKAISIKNKLCLAYGIAKGLCFLNAKQIIHRDFKPHNVLIDGSLVPKIIDFGSAVQRHNSVNTLKVFDERLLFTEGFHIPYQSLSPQLQQKITLEAYNKHPLFDVFGFGKTLCYLFFGTLKPPTPESISSMPFPELFEHILFIIYMCLQMDPDERPIFGQLASYIGILPEFIKLLIEEQSENQENKQELMIF